MITTYEVMLLLPGNHSENKATAAIDKIKKELQRQEAEIILGDTLGRRLLTYPIKKQDEAQFHYLHITVEGSKIQKLKDALELNEELLRFLFTKLPENYQTREGQYSVEIVDDIINFGENRIKKTTSRPIPNPEKKGLTSKTPIS